MKKTSRILAAALALLLCLSIVAAALAEAGPLGQIYKAATGLLFETDNASLTAHVAFAYDGFHFKTVDAAYAQDGANSKMIVNMDSVRANGTSYKGGYTVIANDGMAYSIENDMPTIYHATPCGTDTAILSTTVLRRAILSLGSAVANACEPAFADKIAAEQTADGTRYHVTLAEGEAPQLINAAGTLLAQLAASRYFWIDYDQIEKDADSVEVEDYCEVQFDDYMANVRATYKQEYGEDMPEDFYELLWDEEGNMNETLYERYDHVMRLLDFGLREELAEQYKTGVVLVYPDGTHTHYATEDEYMIANGLQYVYFENSDAIFQLYYAEKTGETLSDEALAAIQISGNEELSTVFWNMYEDMNTYYEDLLAADGKASVLYVRADGSYDFVYDVRAFWRSMYSIELTVTQTALCDMFSLALGESDFTVTLDAEGRFAAANGSVTILVTDEKGTQRPLEIAFDLTGGSYGATEVETFDPAAYGAVSWEEYYNDDAHSYYEQTYREFLDSLPKTVTFLGVEYTVDLPAEPIEGDI